MMQYYACIVVSPKQKKDFGSHLMVGFLFHFVVVAP